MTPDGNGASRRQRRRAGAHRKRRRNSALRRTAVVGGAVVCIGVAYEVSTPTVNALSIVIPLGDVNGSSNSLQINIFEGNIFLTQLGIGRGNVSNLGTIGGFTTADGNNGDEALGSPQFVPAKPGHGNVTQINLFSFNIVNPQIAFGGSNVSNNVTVSNVSTGNGNYSRAEASPAGSFLTTWVNGMTGNGNTTQLSFFSGNIFNPQWSSGGTNVSNNTAVTNISAYNGNHSATKVTPSGIWGSALFGLMTGNGNTTQAAAVTSNIFNPQFSFGGGNQSFNTATTNDSTGNGNSSATQMASGGWGLPVTFGGAGNGNTNQFASGTSNINNYQFHFSLGTPIGSLQPDTSAGSPGSADPASSTASSVGAPGSVGSVAVGSDDSSVSVVGTDGSPAPDASFSARIRDAVDRTLGSDQNTTPERSSSETSSSLTRFTAYGGDSGEDPADSTDHSAASGDRLADSGDRPSATGDRPADSPDRPADSGDGPASSGGKGESGNKGDQ